MLEYSEHREYMDKAQYPDKILSNTIIVFDWVKSIFGVLNDMIIVCGPSLGASQTISLSTSINIKVWFLISVFTSIKNIVADKNVTSFLSQS